MKSSKIEILETPYFCYSKDMTKPKDVSNQVDIVPAIQMPSSLDWINQVKSRPSDRKTPTIRLNVVNGCRTWRNHV